MRSLIPSEEAIILSQYQKTEFGRSTEKKRIDFVDVAFATRLTTPLRHTPRQPSGRVVCSLPPLLLVAPVHEAEAPPASAWSLGSRPKQGEAELAEIAKERSLPA